MAEDIYTAESMAALKLAVSDAKDVYDNADASQEDIDAQVDALQAAIDGLKKADSGKPDNPSGSHNNNGDSEKWIRAMFLRQEMIRHHDPGYNRRSHTDIDSGGSYGNIQEKRR